MALNITKRKNLRPQDARGLEKIESRSKSKEPEYIEKLSRVVKVLINETKVLAHLNSEAITRYRQATQVRDIAQDWTNTILNLPKFSQYWIRPPEDFKSKSHSPSKQISALLRHLFAKYKTPEFLNTCFVSETNIPIFVHIAQGGNIRTASNKLPKLTKAQAHIFHTTSQYIGLEQAIIRAQAISYKVEERLLPSVINNPRIQVFAQNAFWQTFLEFIGRQGMVNPEQIGPLCDYLAQHQNIIEDGVTKPFSFKGKTMTSIIRRMEEWHHELTKAKNTKNRTWKPHSQITKAVFPSPENPFREISEICTEKGLLAEGKAMHHCVYSYTEMCCSGRCSIWTMKTILGDGPTNIATIEVIGNVIHQIKGPYNSHVPGTYLNEIRKWAVTFNLKWQVF